MLKRTFSDAKRARPEGTLLPSEATKRNDPFASLCAADLFAERED